MPEGIAPMQHYDLCDLFGHSRNCHFLSALSTTIVIFIRLILLATKCMFKHQDCQMFGLKINKRKFHPLGVVRRGRENQLQVDANLNN